MYTIYNPELKFALFDMKLLPFCLLILLKLLIKTAAPHGTYVFWGAAVLSRSFSKILLKLPKKGQMHTLCILYLYDYNLILARR